MIIETTMEETDAEDNPGIIIKECNRKEYRLDNKCKKCPSTGGIVTSILFQNIVVVMKYLLN